MDRAGENGRRPGRATPGVRLQRVLADAGVGARRACERLIEEGRVRVNGQTVSTLPAFVDPDADRIEVNGRLVGHAQRRLYIMVNKPARVLVTAKDEPEAGRRTVNQLVDHPARARLYPVGRLDFETTGLVLLTNDGALANRLTHPRYGVPRLYEVVVKGSVEPASLHQIERSIAKSERRAARSAGMTRPARVTLAITGAEPDRTTLQVTLHEGRTRHEGGLGSLLGAAGLKVRKIERIGLGPLRLRAVAQGQWRELERAELQALRRAAAGLPTDSADEQGAGDRPGRPPRRERARTGSADPRRAVRRAGARRQGGRRPGRFG